MLNDVELAKEFIKSLSKDTQELYCEAGDHNWTAPIKRGRKPKNCPDHKPQAKAKPAKTAGFAAVIERVLADGVDDSCTCDIKSDMTWDELTALGAGCSSPDYVCPSLVRVRRAVEKSYSPQS